VKFVQAGYDLIKEFEGCALVSYMDNGAYAIGYGHRSGVLPNQTITADQALALLEQDVAARVNQVTPLLKQVINDNQFSAIICLVFNIGIANFMQSTVLRCVNSGHYDDAANAFLLWDKENGVEVPGLLRRRKAERDLFLAPVPFSMNT